MITRSIWLSSLFLAYCVGCGRAYSPIPMEIAREFQSGTPVAEIEKALGPSHPPSSTQSQQLEGVMSHMPPNVRANAERDRTVAWGDEKGFLVAKVNEQGIAWVVAWRAQ